MWIRTRGGVCCSHLSDGPAQRLAWWSSPIAPLCHGLHAPGGTLQGSLLQRKPWGTSISVDGDFFGPPPAQGGRHHPKSDFGGLSYPGGSVAAKTGFLRLLLPRKVDAQSAQRIFRLSFLPRGGAKRRRKKILVTSPAGEGSDVPPSTQGVSAQSA